MTKILATPVGDHSPESWAMATAEMICDPSDLKGERQIAAKKLQLAIAEALMPHHGNVQNAENDNLAANGSAHLAAEPDVDAHVDQAVADVLALTKGTPWESHYAQPQVAEGLRATIRSHFLTSVKTERGWHAHRNPNDPHSQRFHAALHGETISAGV